MHPDQAKSKGEAYKPCFVTSVTDYKRLFYQCCHADAGLAVTM